MYKTCLLIMLSVLLSLAGCTSKANNIADQAFARASANTDSIVYDLYTGYTQLAVDHYAGMARAAAKSGNEDAAAQAVTGFATEYDKITWLARTQYERSKAMYLIARRYIWQQRGWWSVLAEDWKNAKEAEAADKAETEQPDTG